MPDSDYGDFDDDDLIAATGLLTGDAPTDAAAAAAAADFEDSPRPAKRLKLDSRTGYANGSLNAYGFGREKSANASGPAPLASELHAMKNRFAPPPRPAAGKVNGGGVAHGSKLQRPGARKAVVKTSTKVPTYQYTASQIPSSDSPHRNGYVSRTGVGLPPSKKKKKQTPQVGAAECSDSDDAFESLVIPRFTTGFDTNGELADIPSDAFDYSSSSPQKSQSSRAGVGGVVAAPQTGLRQTTLFGRGLEARPASQLNNRLDHAKPAQDEPPTHHQLNIDAMTTWIYPINIGSIRDYQFNIVQRGLFHNLLVALPTGLGKTFIAATIMLNWYRWTKSAQIVFVAPTKPLVSQQVQACFGIAGIPRSDTSMLTGGVSPGLRAEEWSSKRVFFMTPQTMINDLKSGICDPKRLILIVIDEAHKATGAYAYAEIVKFVRRFNQSFRVLALTATPGSDVESVQEVIDSLDISRVEIRTEQSLDIRQYVYHRQIDKHVFDNTDEMEMCMDLYSKAVRPVLARLNGQNAYWVKDPIALTPFGLTKAMGQWFASDAGRKAPYAVKGMVKTIFSTLASLAHSMDLLKYHGMRPFYSGLQHFQDQGDTNGGKYRKEIVQNEDFQKMMSRLRTWNNLPDFIGHPKLEFLTQRVLTHFMDAGDGRGLDCQPPSSTRVMIFAHWRDSAEDIVRVLKRHEPMIRAHVFVGQAASRNSDGMDQKYQLEIMHKFKTGAYNTLVATSIGEEGLDIGEIDLIVCYDSKASPIRMLQRMGRTGRKRAGKIILLQMKGKEETDAAKAKDNYEKMQEMIANGTRFTFHDDRNRRIVPKEFQPLVDKRVVDIPLENSQEGLPEPKKRGGRAPKRPPKKFNMPDGAITGFVSVSRLNDDPVFVELSQNHKPAKAKAQAAPRDDIAINPPLSELVLSPSEEAQLDRYLSVTDDSEVITLPNLTRYPERQRQPYRTIAFKSPGRASKGFVKAVNAMSTVDAARVSRWEDMGVTLDTTSEEDLGLPRDFINMDVDMVRDAVEIVEFDVDMDTLPLPKHTKAPKAPRAPRAPKAPKTPKAPKAPRRGAKTTVSNRVSDMIEDDMVADGRSSSPPATDPRMRFLSQAVSLGDSDTSGEDEEDDVPDSELADFIADDLEPVPIATSSPPPPSRIRPSHLFSSSVHDNDDSDEELPDATSFARPRKKGAVPPAEVLDVSSENEEEGPVVVAQQAGRKRLRRVVDSDDSEE
ncbi:P-loop containing nucleoside triphosphate hydrolase protein [Pseudovirgaria hyperparasitica]|uniref:ATP-dependent DNA helicase n=1 Tax=Pseudovirgaria hyperparasitica TaxID=470096 RepID=A0A6A6VSJ6_9PEZI|nr:P-loop containing nucleoside triphosphate hydrolase protein [Pseudovirgaria hyperparasitica]KAF2753193.1 P-loop containing nucleoside triphosphate hydrolase protein [Pseudovirgaria hyperparasitica]